MFFKMHRTNYYTNRLGILLLLAWIVIGFGAIAQTNEDCLMCHEDPDLSIERNGKSVSLFMNEAVLKNTVHSKIKCAECHQEPNPDEFAHSEGGDFKIPTVNCAGCHKSAGMQFDRGIHGTAFKEGAPYAPSCKECHGTHKILSGRNPESVTYKMNIPYLCGNCHKEGSPVARIYNITEHNIIENYSQGIHGKGLFESGLLVTATCNDCHGNHQILPATDRSSSVNPNRVARTCMKCHVQIEKTHKKVIKNELWEEKPGAVPSCTDCHPPHIVQNEKIEESISNQSCLSCHDKENAMKKVTFKGDTIHMVEVGLLNNSVHNNIPCMKCHTDVNPKLERPCEPVKRVDCSNCHNEVSNQYFDSGHGKAFLAKSTDAPYCTDCHGTHGTKWKTDETSSTYRGNIPKLCGECHQKDGKANAMGDLKEVDAFADYSKSIHGQGLTEKGLLVSAICTDCHTTHHELKESDPASSVNPLNVPTTCATCHKSIYEDYINSDHSIRNNTSKLNYPTCTTCHSAHVISEIDKDKFMNEVTVQCGACHEKLSETYKETYHGKAYQLGDLNAARCSDCHGAHKILKVENPNSKVGYKNIVNTCKQCHANANLEFTGYLTHATHNDNDVLFYSFWAMTTLLVSVFAFFGLHTLIWLPQSLKQRRKNKHTVPKGPVKYYRRFNKRQRFTHLMVILSFLLLALTGMTLKFAHMEWASFVADLLGGVKSAGNIHRFAAVVTFGYFAFHLSTLFQLRAKEGISVKEFLFGKNSLMFSKQDIKDLGASIKWFFGQGPRPEYGRWTYWEKFDYMAVFWGVAVIGLSGLILWFPEFFTLFIPGWAINVAQIIHSDEALLATGFIFTIHFFNTHLRPESFPMDTVIFTGHVPLEEYKKDRPREYRELVESGKLDSVVVEKEFSKTWLKIIRFFGFLFLSLGVIMIILIVYSLIMGSY
jgi:predicted CXXCH cytochrome family protein